MREIIGNYYFEKITGGKPDIMENEIDLKDRYSSRNLWSGILFGLGLIAFIDETIFHQLLHWHHFYDRSTTNLGLVSDGFFHAFSWFATIGGLFLFADLKRRQALSMRRWWGGVLIGAGSFQLYDGIIQHKVLRIHQIRYVDDVIIYDVIWNLGAIALIVIGFTLLYHSSHKKEKGDSVFS